MYIFFVDLGVVVYVDTEWVVWDFVTKIRYGYQTASSGSVWL